MHQLKAAASFTLIVIFTFDVLYDLLLTCLERIPVKRKSK